jgi:hypothetical protein
MVLDQNDIGEGPGLRAATASWRLDQRTKKPVLSRAVLVRILSSGHIARLPGYRGGQSCLGLDAGGRRQESRPVSTIAATRDGSDQVALRLMDENPGGSRWVARSLSDGRGSEPAHRRIGAPDRAVPRRRQRLGLLRARDSALDPDIAGYALSRLGPSRLQSIGAQERRVLARALTIGRCRRHHSANDNREVRMR